MTEDEVLLAMGEPDRTASSTNGRTDWIYTRSKKLLIVQFGRNGKVESYKTQGGTSSSAAKKKTTTTKRRKTSSAGSWTQRKGTPL